MTDVAGYVSAPLSSARQPEISGLLTRLHTWLLTAFLLNSFVGTHPFEETSVAGRADGSSIDRIVVIGMFLVALRLLWQQRSAVLPVVLRSLPILALTGFALASLFWSDYPDLTLRRAVLLIFLTTIALAIAMGVCDLRRLHTFLFVFLSGVIVVNLIGTVVAPSLSITDIGVKGMYTQKNVAGIVAMVTMIIGVTWMFGATNRKSMMLALAALALTLVFLVLTRSKTSINLAVVGVGLAIYFALAEKWGVRFILLTGAVGLVLLAGVLMVLTFYEFDGDLVLGKIVGDSSFSGRDELWAFTRRDADRRFWLGHGYGAYWDVGMVNDPLVRAEPGSWLGSVETGIINQAHHGYIELWLHIGWPATVVATLAVIYALLRSGYIAIFGGASNEVRAFIGACSVILLVHLIHNFTEATLFMRGSLFWNTITLVLFIVARLRDFVPLRPA